MFVYFVFLISYF